MRAVGDQVLQRRRRAQVGGARGSSSCSPTTLRKFGGMLRLTSRIGGGDADELLLSLLRTGASVRERESAAAALADAGSHDAVASAVAILEGAPDAHIGPEQALRLRAVHARARSSGAVSLDAAVRGGRANASTCAAGAASRRSWPTRCASTPSAAAG